MNARWISLALLLCVLCLDFAPAACAVTEVAPSPTPAETPGADVARMLSTVTGVAISPLLGMSAVGAWQWARTPQAQRAGLPWFTRPWFWLPALVLVGVCLAKDTFGVAAPTVLKKPFDVADAVEHKISGLVAAGAFVPLAAMVFAPPEARHTSLAAAGFATLDLHWLYNALMVPVALFAYVVVFLASNAINILILLSPFTTVDAALKSVRGVLLATLTAAAFGNPWFGALWALVIVLVSMLIAGWSFRLTVLGMVSIWDVLSGGKRRFTPKQANWMFLSRRTAKVPTRTAGWLTRGPDGGLVFRYRPWLVLRERTLALPAGSYAVGRGLIWSEIVRNEGDDIRSVLILPPRCRGHEVALSEAHGLAGVRPTGLRALFAWLFGTASRPATAAAG